MGKKNKLAKFAEISEFSNVFEHNEAPKGNWSGAFEKNQPLVLELACGKGEYTVGLARMFPERNFLGLDIKGNRIWRGAKTALEENITNAAFLRCQINRITDHFAPGEVSEIWITFADPQPRDGKAKKRLTHHRFIEMYKQVSVSPLTINLKCDSTLLYEFTKEVIAENNYETLVDVDDVYAWEERPEELNIRTFYESMWLEEGKKIKYLKFRV
ncbi:MAG: tRNA (guanosine(46)-N7)-methyltransferase TrmB [Bacteroidia bacterium]|nr:tRNA (guanosine(46)-N7)-methyltransferase TrmB [Bacteroidia bacterium]